MVCTVVLTCVVLMAHSIGHCTGCVLENCSEFGQVGRLRIPCGRYEVARRKPGELGKIAVHVRLIVIGELGGYGSDRLAAMEERKGVMKTNDPSETFWRQSGAVAKAPRKFVARYAQPSAELLERERASRLSNLR